MSSSKTPMFLLLLLNIGWVVGGCSATKQNDMGSEEGAAVASLVESLNDYKGNDQQIAAVYLYP
ncbi:MAG: hypothetical protein ACK5OB_10015, partial [Pirellula sp.]